MILGKDINPKRHIYYISALVINELNMIEDLYFDFFEIFKILNSKHTEITLNVYSLALDWLYLLGAISKEGDKLKKCF